MLIKCKECGLQISSEAIFCPHCGLPIKPEKIMKISKPKKLPNGFGQITKLPNKALRKPYRAMITVGHTPQGKPISKLLKPVAYFKTYNEAYDALVQNAKSPYDKMKEITLEELHESWLNDKFQEKISKSMRYQYHSAWAYCSALHKEKVANIKTMQIKELLLDPKIPDSVRKNVKALLSKLFDMAIENEIVDKNYCRIINNDSLITYSYKKSHIAFTDEEISILWDHVDNIYVKWILIQCYTGLRPRELCRIKNENINLDEDYFIGGMKTEAGTNRIIPIHRNIKPLIEDFYDPNKENLLYDNSKGSISYDKYKIVFKNVMARYNLSDKHLPHDARKFFVTKAKESGLDEYAIKRIIGHAIRDLTESTYTERSISWLVSQINLINV